MIILGFGYTTKRLAHRNTPYYLAGRDSCPKGDILIHSVPTLAEPDKSALRNRIQELAPRRIVYISSTGVYGPHTHVDENTPPAPNDEKGTARLDEEEWLTTQAPTLILRSAAIYGPGRGIHVHLREGTSPRSSGGLVSRIHVDDLAALLEAAASSPLEGVWPVADDLPATSEEVAEWCANYMGLTPRAGARQLTLAGRSVDGKNIRELLKVNLKYPDYKSGIAASITEEQFRSQVGRTPSSAPIPRSGFNKLRRQPGSSH